MNNLLNTLLEEKEKLDKLWKNSIEKEFMRIWIH